MYIKYNDESKELSSPNCVKENTKMFKYYDNVV